MFTPEDRGLERGWPGRIEDDRVVQLAAQTLESFFTGGGKAREHAVYPLSEVRLRPPVLHPPSVRSFAATGLAFAFANPASIHGPEDEVAWPEDTRELCYELELAAIIGADEEIGGFTIMNDWRTPDLDAAKSGDFATSLGPVVVTPDEFDGTEAVVVARINGEERSRATLGREQSWDELRAYAARNTRLVPGDVLGAGALLQGCRIRRGDRVELEVEGIGVLVNRVV